MAPKRDKKGGFAIPEDRLKDARGADLITLPEKVEGKSCASCIHMMQNSTCNHRSLNGLYVNRRQVCKHWHNSEIFEPWAEAEKAKAGAAK
jgi:hypothetical protein